jgi:hypothetical protein
LYGGVGGDFDLFAASSLGEQPRPLQPSLTPTMALCPDASQPGWTRISGSFTLAVAAVSAWYGDLALSQKLSSRHRRLQEPIPSLGQEHGGQAAAAIAYLPIICDASSFDQKSHSL